MALDDITNAKSTARRAERRGLEVDGSSVREGKRRRSGRLQERNADDHDVTDARSSSSGTHRTTGARRQSRFHLGLSKAQQVDMLVQLVQEHRKDPKFRPEDWQLEAAIKILHGWDGILGAATGSGKSLVWELVALAACDETLLVICPIVALESDQVHKYANTRIRAVSVSETINAPLGPVSTDKNAALIARRAFVRKTLIDTFANLVFASPESILHNPAMDDILKNNTFKQRLRAIVVDEAHIVETWGLTPSARHKLPFRPAFSEIQTLRARFGSHLPLLAVSATLPSRTVRAILPILDFGSKNTFAIDAGVDRVNVAYSLLPLQFSATSYLDILNLFDPSPSSPAALPKTLIYVQTRSAAYAVATLLHKHYSKLGPEWVDTVRPFTAFASPEYKQDIIHSSFQPNGPIRILISTEAGGLGIDLPDIQLVVQFELPHSILELAQHFGRVMRDRSRTGTSLLLAPAWSIIHEDVDGEGAKEDERRSRLEPSLRSLTNITKCMRSVITSATKLKLETVKSALQGFECIDGGLKAFLDDSASKATPAAPHLSSPRKLTTMTYTSRPASSPSFCCTSASCSPDQRGKIGHRRTIDEEGGENNQMTRTSTNKPASTFKAPKAHSAMVKVQGSLADSLQAWRRRSHRAGLLPKYLSQENLLPGILAERLLAQAGRLLAIRRTTDLNVHHLDTLLGPLTSLLFPGTATDLAATLSGWAQTYITSNPAFLNHISSTGSYLDSPAPRPLQR
ncbi:hypothetical protein CF319_g5551 [Tilletia indica]|nr:hypothetical protein CF319_g5551 [Tilletia indica]